MLKVTSIVLLLLYVSFSSCLSCFCAASPEKEQILLPFFPRIILPLGVFSFLFLDRACKMKMYLYPKC